jgi:hypothetical protein
MGDFLLTVGRVIGKGIWGLAYSEEPSFFWRERKRWRYFIALYANSNDSRQASVSGTLSGD